MSASESARISLPLRDWPEADQQLWAKALAPRGPFDDEQGASHWRKATREILVAHYGAWLAYAADHGWLAEPPHERITEERVKDYWRALPERLAPYSVLGRIKALGDFWRVTAPDTLPEWLRKAILRLQRDARPVTKDASRIVAPRRLFEIGLETANAVADDAMRGQSQATVAFRDGLMVAFLAARPLRARSFVSLEVGTSLRRGATQYHLSVPSQAVKTRRPIEQAVPMKLTRPLDTYLAHVRPALMKKARIDHRHVWVTRRGTAFNALGLCQRLTSVTPRLVGVPLSPHLFRDCAATGIAEESPEEINLIADILGHSNLAMAEKHYNQAGSISAVRRHQDMLASLRNRAVEAAHLDRRPSND